MLAAGGRLTQATESTYTKWLLSGQKEYPIGFVASSQNKVFLTKSNVR